MVFSTERSSFKVRDIHEEILSHLNAKEWMVTDSIDKNIEWNKKIFY